MSYELKYLKYKNKYLKLKEYLGGTRDQSTILIIPDSVVRIAEKEYSKKGLTEVKIPNSVQMIGDFAFYENLLTTLIIPDSVKMIGDWAFCHNKLKTLAIPDSVKTIGKSAFSQNQLTTLRIPNSIKTIGDSAFASNLLTELIIPNSVKIIGEGVFYNNKLTTLIIPDSVETIGDSAFSKNQLTTLIIPDSVKTIGEMAFSDNKLTTLIIPDSVKTIGRMAFSRNQLTTLIIPDSVKLFLLGTRAFADNQLTTLRIPNSVETIGTRVFSDNKLTTLIIPNSVKTIGTMAFYRNQLTTLIIPNSVETICIGAFSKNQLTELTIPNSVKMISGRAFYENPDSVETIGLGAFSDNKLTTLIIPESVKTIGTMAFSRNQLTTLIIPNSVETIDIGAFSDNPLTEIFTYNKKFNDLKMIHLITGIDINRIIIDKRQSAPYTIRIRIREDIEIPYITGNGLTVNIKYTIDEIKKKRINNFIDQLYTNTEFKQLIDNDENNSLYIILTQKIIKSDGHTKEIRDPAIDADGVTSFMFNNLLDDFTKRPDPYFKFIDNYYILNDRILVDKSPEEKTELKKKIEFIGKLFAYALQLEQTIDIDLHPLLLYKMLFGIDVQIDENQIDENQIDYLINNFDLDRKESPFGCFIEPVVKACKYDSDSDDGLELTDIEIIKKNAIERINTSESYNNEILNSFVTGFRTKIGFNDKKYKCITSVSTLSELISGKNKMWSINELMENLVFDSEYTSSTSSKDKFLMIIKKVITDELIKEGELKEGQSITEAMCNQIENETIKLWISLFIKLLTNRKKIPIDEFRDKKLTISFINDDEFDFIPYSVHTCSHTMDIYTNDIEKLDKSLLYHGLSIDHMKVQVGDLGLA